MTIASSPAKHFAHRPVNSMIRLLYISHAAPTISDEQVQDILRSSRRNNPANSITGILLYGGGMFMQFLEGPEHEVLRSYVKILDDSRHTGAEIIYISPTTRRIFKEWSMGGLESDPLQSEHISKLRARRLEVVEANAFTETMREFAQRLRDAR